MRLDHHFSDCICLYAFLYTSNFCLAGHWLILQKRSAHKKRRLYKCDAIHVWVMVKAMVLSKPSPFFIKWEPISKRGFWFENPSTFTIQWKKIFSDQYVVSSNNFGEEVQANESSKCFMQIFLQCRKFCDSFSLFWIKNTWKVWERKFFRT